MHIPLDALPAPTLVLDEDGVILDVNERAGALLGAERDALIGRSMNALVPRDARRAGDGPEGSEWTIDGRTYLTIEHPGPGEEGRVVLFVDVTQLAVARDRAVALARDRSDFHGKLSHEIRSSVASITGFAEMLESDLSGVQRDMVRVITRNGRHLMETLDAMMELARVEFLGTEVTLSDVDVIGLMKAKAASVRPEAERKGLQLRVRAAEEALYVCVNPTYLDRILHNLVDNAVKYTDEGRIELEAERRDGRIWMYVADTGRGMDAAFLPRLFSPFEREHRSDRRSDGTGLGLVVTRELVELMDGRIAVCSTLGEGSTFTVSFPDPDRS